MKSIWSLSMKIWSNACTYVVQHPFRLISELLETIRQSFRVCLHCPDGTFVPCQNFLHTVSTSRYAVRKYNFHLLTYLLFNSFWIAARSASEDDARLYLSTKSAIFWKKNKNSCVSISKCIWPIVSRTRSCSADRRIWALQSSGHHSKMNVVDWKYRNNSSLHSSPTLSPLWGMREFVK